MFNRDLPECARNYLTKAYAKVRHYGGKFDEMMQKAAVGYQAAVPLVAAWRCPGWRLARPCGRAGGYADTRGGGGQTLYLHMLGRLTRTTLRRMASVARRVCVCM